MSSAVWRGPDSASVPLCRQWYTDLPQNLRVENGKLVLQVSPSRTGEETGWS